MKKIVLLSVVILGFGASAASAQPGWGYRSQPNVNFSIGSGYNGVQWGVSVGNGYPVAYPNYNYNAYPTYPVYQVRPACPTAVPYYPQSYYYARPYRHGYYQTRSHGWGHRHCR